METERKMLRRIVVEPELSAVTGLGKTTRWRKAKAGDFPMPVRMANGRVGVFEDELIEWQSNLPRVNEAPITTPRSPGRYAQKNQMGVNHE